ncbi:hypothetical protein ACVWXN_010837 [Bradyrhizobium sp. i1.4.4]
MLRATWRGLETWYGQATCWRASPRPYLGGRGGGIPPAPLDYLRAYDSVSEARNSIGRYLDFYNSPFES